MRILALITSFFLLSATPVLAQNTSFGFSPAGQTQTMSVTGTSSTLTLSTNIGTTVLVQNTGTAIAYVKVTGGVATASDFPIQAGWGVVLNLPPGQVIAAISSSTTTLTFSKGLGATAIAAAGSGGGGGGTVNGNVSNAADGVATTSTNIGSAGYNYVWDSVTPGWDRWYGNINGGFVQGSIADGVADAGNPVKTGGVYLTTAPTYTNGQRGTIQLGSRGSVNTTILGPNNTTSASVNTMNGDAQSAATTGLVTGSFGYLYNNSTWDRMRSINGASSNGTGTLSVAIAPITSGGITAVVSASAESSHVLKAAQGNLYSVYATNQTTTAGFLVVLNATSAPADGAITPIECTPLPASGNASINYNPGPPSAFSTGIVAVVSSGANCFTKTTGVITAFIKGSVQ